MGSRDIIKLVAGKPAHPEGGVPGGVTKGISEEERGRIQEDAASMLEFAKTALEIFKQHVLEDRESMDMIQSDTFNLKTYYMGMTDKAGRLTFQDGDLVVIDPFGKRYAEFDARDYIDHIGEWVESWTYIKLCFLKKIGWTGLKEGEGTALYRVAPLARLNVADGMATPLAQHEYEIMFETLGGKPAHNTLAMHWARLICALQAAVELNILGICRARRTRRSAIDAGGDDGIPQVAVGCFIACNDPRPTRIIRY